MMVLVGTKQVPTRDRWTLLVRDGGVGRKRRFCSVGPVKATYLGNKSRNKKGSDCSEPFFEFNPGGDLRSRVVSSAVSSARQGLTSVFGMGTGVTLAVRPPGNLCIETGDR